MHRPVVALAAVSLLTLTACGGSDDEEGGSAGGNASGGTQEVTAGVIPIVDVAPIYLGVDQGFFEDCGLSVTLESGQGGAAIVPGVANGDFEFGFSNVTSLLVAASKGLPLQMVANGVATTGEQGNDYGAVVALPDSGIQDPADLAGKRVAVNTLNNIGTTTVNESVRQAGGDPSTIEYTELPFPDMGAALELGNVDAIWVVEPFVTAATDAGGQVVASNFVDTAENLTVATYFTSRQYAEQNPEAVDCFVEGMGQALTYAQENPDAVREVLSTYTQISPEVSAAMILPEWPTEINDESVQTLADLAVQDGLIDEVPDLDQLLP
jgi:NitT/TauT family transport system substrate-binding protein